MRDIIEDDRRQAFALWLRTGWLPVVHSENGLELKYNPWHDPTTGRFTFAGAGGQSGTTFTKGGKRDFVRNASRFGARDYKIATHEGRDSRSHGPEQTNPAWEFVRGTAEGLHDTAVETAKAVYSTLTTDPVTTVRNTGLGIAGAIDGAIAAEDTPARIQVSKAASIIAKASPRELGHVTGTVAGEVALAVAPGAAFSKVAALRQLRMAPFRPSFEPTEIGWVKENLGRDTPAKLYNDAASGARPGHAPTLMRTLPDGSKRPVKFDGLRGDYLIDRKLSVSGRPRAVAQMLRQSEVLSQHRAIGVWEVPSQIQKTKALKLFKKMKITNIHVRIVKP